MAHYPKRNHSRILTRNKPRSLTVHASLWQPGTDGLWESEPVDGYLTPCA